MNIGWFLFWSLTCMWYCRPPPGEEEFLFFYFAIMITFLTTRETSCFGRPWDGMRRAAGGGERQLGGEAASRENICIFWGLPRGREERQRLRKRRTEKDFDLGEKTEDTIRSHFRVDNKHVSECYDFEINFHVLFHLAIHIVMILLCYYLSKNWYFAYWCMR